MKTKWGAEDKAVIAFGGSYGGMLAAWIRMKYPHEIQGALASSAPTVYFMNSSTADSGAFSEIVTQDFAQTFEDQRCSKGIKEGFQYLMDLKTRTGDWPELQSLFQTCAAFEKADDIQDLYTMIANGFNYMAMTDYPANATFLEPMPAFPVNVSCQAFENIEPQAAKSSGKGALSDREKLVLGALKSAADVYFNYTGQISCYNYTDTDASGDLAADGWNVLACNQLPMPIDFGSKDSMFIEELFDYDSYTAECKSKYGLAPQYQWVFDEFGGSNYGVDYTQYSNIIFSNGELDPWKAGGVTSYVSLDLPVYVIRGGAHHLDLRRPVLADNSTNVKWVRSQEEKLIE